MHISEFLLKVHLRKISSTLTYQHCPITIATSNAPVRQVKIETLEGRGGGWRKAGEGEEEGRGEGWRKAGEGVEECRGEGWRKAGVGEEEGRGGGGRWLLPKDATL